MSPAVAEAVAAATRKPIAAIMRRGCKTSSSLFQDEKHSRCALVAPSWRSTWQSALAHNLGGDPRPMSEVAAFPRAARPMALRSPRDSWMTDQPLAILQIGARLCARAEGKSLRRNEERLAACILDLGGPEPLNRADDLARHGHVVEILLHLAALGVGPVEEFERSVRGRRIARLLVDQNESRTGDRPARGPPFIGEDHAEAGRSFPVRAGSSGDERLDGRRNRLASLVHQPGIGELALLDVGVLDVADRTLHRGHAAGGAFVAPGADPEGPFDRGGRAHLRPPVAAHLAEIIGEHEGGAGTVGAIHDPDRL